MLISGAPGTGETVLAQQLPAALPVAVVEKDVIKETLFVTLARMHRRRASGQCPEAARGCSCESRIMVLKQQSRPQNKEHPIDATTQPSRFASKSRLTTTAWWPMLVELGYLEKFHDYSQFRRIDKVKA